MSQHTKILNLLKKSEWVCTSFMYASFIADPRTRLSELKKQGHNLNWRWCENPNHKHEGQMKEWQLTDYQIKKDFEIVDNIISGFSPCCYSSYKFGTHDPNCKSLIKQTNKTLF